MPQNAGFARYAWWMSPAKRRPAVHERTAPLPHKPSTSSILETCSTASDHLIEPLSCRTDGAVQTSESGASRGGFIRTGAPNRTKPGFRGSRARPLIGRGDLAPREHPESTPPYDRTAAHAEVEPLCATGPPLMRRWEPSRDKTSAHAGLALAFLGDANTKQHIYLVGCCRSSQPR